MAPTDTTVRTIGRSTHPAPEFIDLLQRHGVAALADVRAIPYSRFNRQFNRETLSDSLDACGIVYVFLGRELGGRSQDPGYYDFGRISYERLGRTVSFQKGLDCGAEGANGFRIALMCAEREPLECHRCLLVAPALEARGVSVDHIHSNGVLESHGNAMGRLLVMYGLQDSLQSQRLFPRPLAERTTEAIARQARRFAHRIETRANNSTPRNEMHP